MVFFEFEKKNPKKSPKASAVHLRGQRTTVALTPAPGRSRSCFTAPQMLA